MEQEFELIAKTFMGLEPVLAEELTQLGANNVQIGRRMVSFTGDKEMMYRANFQLHTAIRILKPIKHFKARSAEEVYDEIQKIKWDDILDVKKTFSVDSVVYSEEFRNSRFVTYKVKVPSWTGSARSRAHVLTSACLTQTSASTSISQRITLP